jgi:polar amino acid transport system substrate-binding protein
MRTNQIRADREPRPANDRPDTNLKGGRKVHKRLFVTAAVGALVAATASALAATNATIPPPARIAAAGKIVYCSDISYPPEEFYKGSTPAGSDIDLGGAIAKLMGVKAEFKNTTFDSVIAALMTKKCDAIISGMNDTAARRTQVAFVDYLKVGQSLMVKKGNPEHISKLSDLSGKSVSVESATTNRAFLTTQSSKLVKAGKQPIQVKTFPKDTDAVAALKAGRVDAYFGDSPVVVYYVLRDSSLAIGGAPVAPIPVGIAIRKSDPLKSAVQKAVDRLYATGTIKRIVAKWGMTKAVTMLK